MIELAIGNSYSRITGLDKGQLRELKQILSYNLNPQATFFSKDRHGGKRYLVSDRGGFPSGLLYLVEKWLADSKVSHRTVDSRRLPTASGALFEVRSTHRPYQEQIDAVASAVSFGQGAISMPTGTGKSLTMGLLVGGLQLRTLVVVPNLGLKRQLKESFKERFGDTKDIVIENIDSPALNKLTDFDVLIIDECHHSAAKTYRNLNKKAWTGIYHRFFFTATPYRSKEEEQLLMEAITGPVIYELKYTDAVAKGLIVPVEAYYVELPKTRLKGDTTSWASVYSELVVNNKTRNAVIARLMNVLWTEEASTLTLVKEIKNGNNIQELTQGAFANGVSDDCSDLITAFSTGRLKSLIATTGVCGEGVDTKPCEYVIIAGLGRSRPAFLQQVGRGVRTYPGKSSCKIILFKDESHKFTKNHFKEQVKFLKEYYGIIPVKLNIDFT